MSVCNHLRINYPSGKLTALTDRGGDSATASFLNKQHVAEWLRVAPRALLMGGLADDGATV
eukprot:6905781-Alexandrium_andersonii.AAC.1